MNDFQLIQIGQVSFYIIETGPLGVNMALLAHNETREAALIDPAGDIQLVKQILENNGFRLTSILHTHAHFDHCFITDTAVELARKYTPEPVVALHQNEISIFENAENYASRFGISMKPHQSKINHILNDGDEIYAAGIKLKVLHTPGHSPGSVCFYYEQGGLLIAGDTLFRMSVGRVDLPGGNQQDLLESIEQKLFTLPNKTNVIPGHGEFTRIDFEKVNNYVLQSMKKTGF